MFFLFCFLWLSSSIFQWKCIFTISYVRQKNFTHFARVHQCFACTSWAVVPYHVAGEWSSVSDWVGNYQDKALWQEQKKGLDCDESNLFQIWPQHKADCTVEGCHKVHCQVFYGRNKIWEKLQPSQKQFRRQPPLWVLLYLKSGIPLGVLIPAPAITTILLNLCSLIFSAMSPRVCWWTLPRPPPNSLLMPPHLIKAALSGQNVWSKFNSLRNFWDSIGS